MNPEAHAHPHEQEYPTNADGRHCNSDPLAITYLAKLAVTKRGKNLLGTRAPCHQHGAGVVMEARHPERTA